MKLKIASDLRATRRFREKIRPEDYSTVPAEERLFYSVFLDYTKLNALVVKAAENHGEKSLCGPLEVLINRRERTR
jgi:hypothetical protein